MASFTFSGITELNDLVTKMSDVPDEVINGILTAMGEEAIADIRETGKGLGVYDPGWTGTHVLDSMALSKPKRNDDHTYSITVKFKGSRKRGNTTTSNSEIAFLNEFGANRRGIPAKNFVAVTKATKGDRIMDAGEKVFHDYLDKLDI